MSGSNARKFGAVAGSVLLASGAVAFAAPLANASEQAPAAAEVAEAASQERADAVSAASVEGAFSYDQAVVTPAGDIAGVFMKAANAVCASLPDYCVCMQRVVAVSGPAGAFEATVDDMATEDGAQSYIMGCACASNVAGGGAVANAEVSGVSLASVAALAGAL